MFVALAYFMPMIGGLVADWFFGKYKVIFMYLFCIVLDT
jgi:POT family proton-dependent oligopeptide transporter